LKNTPKNAMSARRFLRASCTRLLLVIRFTRLKKWKLRKLCSRV
jgi:hypothetical protein